MLQSGQQFGPYKILSTLGLGGMGAVYKAFDPRLGRNVALKTLAPEKDNERRQLRFAQEARAASALNHPNIITIYEIGKYEGQPYLAMEFIEGETLRQLGKSKAEISTLLPIFRQIAEALAAAHANGIVHRDLKPENIMVRADGYVKVLDFGLARQSYGVEDDDTRSLITKPGTVLGTTRYMSPEQAFGEVLDARTDVFSMGVVFYELLTGARPFEASSTQAYLRAVLTENPVHPSRRNPDCPVELGTLVMTMLSQDKMQRPDAAGVRAALADPPALRPAIAAAAAGRTIVGREAELGRLRSAFQSVQSGAGIMICVTGEPGLGKTTLAEEFLDELGSHGTACWTARGHCSERLGETDAHLAILEALASLVRGPSGDRANALMKEHAPTWQQMVAPAVTGLTVDNAQESRPPSHERMRRELLTFLEELSRLRALVFFCDDVHWSDPSTSDVLSYLGGHIGLSRILILVTYRPKQLTRHPFAAVKLALESRGQCREIPLSFLQPADIDLYVRRTFPAHRFPDEFVGVVHEKTEGNALFMSDMLRYLRDRQNLVEENGAWILTRPLADIRKEIPASIRSMIDLKIAQFSEKERKALLAAAIQGVEFDTAVLSKVLETDPVEIEETLQAIEQRQSFIAATGEHELPDRGITVRYRFVHVFYQNALYAALTPSRRAALSKSIAQTIVSIYSGEKLRAMAADLAMLFEAARDFANAATYYRVAARDAGRVFGYHESVLLCERGLRALLSLPESPERDKEELMFSLTLGIALMATRGYAEDEVERTHLRSRELCLKLGESKRLFAVLWGLHTCYILRGDIRRALDFAHQMRAAAEKRRDQLSMVEAHHAMASTLSALGRMVEAREELDRLFAAFPVSGHVLHGSLYIMDPYVTSLASLARVDAFLGFLDQGLAAAREAVVLANRLGHTPSQAYAELWVGWMHYMRGEYEAAYTHFEPAVALSREHQLPQIMEWNRMMAGASRSQLGAAEGIPIMRTALANLQSMRSVLDRGFCMSVLTEALMRHGQLEEAASTLRTAFQVAEGNGEAYYECEMHRLNAELLIANNQSEAEIEGEIETAIECSRAAQTRTLELRALATLVRWRRLQGHDEEDARRQLRCVLGWFQEGRDTPEIQAAAALLGEVQPAAGAS